MQIGHTVNFSDPGSNTPTTTNTGAPATPVSKPATKPATPAAPVTQPVSSSTSTESLTPITAPTNTTTTETSVAQPVESATQTNTPTESLTPVTATTTTTKPTPTFNLDKFRQTQGLKSDAIVTHEGKRYLRYDPDNVGDFYIGEDGNMYRAKWGGGVGEAIDRQKHLRYSTPNGTRWDRNYNDVYNRVDAFKKATMNKQGGKINTFVNKFKYGGKSVYDIQKHQNGGSFYKN